MLEFSPMNIKADSLYKILKYKNKYISRGEFNNFKLSNVLYNSDQSRKDI